MNQNLILTSIPEIEFRELISSAVNEALAGIKPKEQTPSPVEFLTRKQTAERLKVSLPTLHQWSKTGVVKGYRISGRVRYKSQEIEAALQAMQTTKNDERANKKTQGR
jgi:hypothetical protein